MLGVDVVPAAGPADPGSQQNPDGELSCWKPAQVHRHGPGELLPWVTPAELSPIDTIPSHRGEKQGAEGVWEDQALPQPLLKQLLWDT